MSNPPLAPDAGEVSLDAIADAIERAQCPDREGPYGGYDYGHNESFYGPAPEQGRYVVRDFRDPNGKAWGKPVHYSHDRDEHEAAYATLTRRHIARAAQAAALSEQPSSTGEWRTIDSAPRDGSSFVAYLAGHDPGVGEAWWDDNNDAWVMRAAIEFEWANPTHWMPLPTPPQDGGLG